MDEKGFKNAFDFSSRHDQKEKGSSFIIHTKFFGAEDSRRCQNVRIPTFKCCCHNLTETEEEAIIQSSTRGWKSLPNFIPTGNLLK